MFLDLTANKIDSGVLNNDWRVLILSERDLKLGPVEQVKHLLKRHGVETELGLLPVWPEFAPLGREDFRVFSVNALTSGLAFGPLFSDKIKTTSESLEVEALIERILKVFSAPTFIINAISISGAGWSWNPFSAHTFDLCLIIHDSHYLAVVVVVDED